MKRFVVVLLSIGLLFASADAQRRKRSSRKKARVTPACAVDIGSCALDGCSANNTHDAKLNKLKNIRASTAAPTDRSLAWMKGLDNPATYKPGDARDELTGMGEGEMVRLVGYLLVVKPELGGESCNCYLKTPAETDNHLVLVTSTTVNKYKLPPNAKASDFKRVFGKREPESVTVEFTPRVRADHPNFTREFVEPIIHTTPQGALWVRVTGLLMFDSEHFRHNKLTRVNNWELHPVMRLEYCPNAKQCTLASDDNWVDVDSQ